MLCLNRVIEMHMDGLFVHGNSLERVRRLCHAFRCFLAVELLFSDLLSHLFFFLLNCRSQLQERVRLLEALVMYWDPALAVHLASLEVIGELFCTPWLITLFSDILPMVDILGLWDVLAALGRGFCPCFAASILLYYRDLLLACEQQTSVLLFFSRINAEVIKVDVQACLERALHLYAETPAGLLRLWDPPPASTRRSRTSSSCSSMSSCSPQQKRRASSGALPFVLDHPPTLSSDDLSDLAVTFSSSFGCEMQQDKEKDHNGGVLVLDVRDFTLSDYYHGGKVLLPGVPDEIRRLRLPLAHIRGHVEYCRPLKAIQREMRPPPAIRPYVGKAHIVVYAWSNEGQALAAETRAIARDVARMLVLCKVPFVSIYDDHSKGPAERTKKADHEGKEDIDFFFEEDHKPVIAIA